MALWNQWFEQEKASQLVMSLRSSTQRVLCELAMEDLTDYMRLRTALSNRFYSPDHETAYRCEFKTRRRNREGTEVDYGYWLKRLSSRASSNIQMVMRESLIIEQCVSGLGNPELKRHVQFAHLSTLDRIISIAVEFEALERSQHVQYRNPRPDETVTSVNAIKQSSNTEHMDLKSGNRRNMHDPNDQYH